MVYGFSSGQHFLLCVILKPLRDTLYKYYPLYRAREEDGKLKPRISLDLHPRARETGIEGETKTAMRYEGTKDAIKSN